MGLFDSHRAIDGFVERLSGVMLVIDGRILGGDARVILLLGSYSSSGRAVEGEICIRNGTRLRKRDSRLAPFYMRWDRVFRYLQ